MHGAKHAVPAEPDAHPTGWARRRHFATWVDPVPKPSYLFCLVAGQLASLEVRLEVEGCQSKLFATNACVAAAAAATGSGQLTGAVVDRLAAFEPI